MDGKWLFTGLFASLGFVSGGLYVFHAGHAAATPPAPAPGTANCGNAVMGGCILMFIGAPIAAILFGILGAGLGLVIDCLRLDAGQPKQDSVEAD
jgi:hypothetical protein